MSKRETKSNSRDKLIKSKVPLLFSPYSNKHNNNIIKLNFEPKKIYHETEYNLSKNKIKQKVNIAKINTNSKLFLKKNMTQNISALDFIDNNTSKNIINNNIKFNVGKSSQNFLNSNNTKEKLKKNAASAYELLNNNSINNNNLKQALSKSKNGVKLNNINSLGFIYTSSNEKNNIPVSPPPIGLTPKIIFLKDEKNINNENIGDNDEKKENINCLLRNTFTNVKIYPTTFLNNKIIFQNVDKNTNNDNNNSKIKKEKIIIDTEKPKNEKENFNSIEELHFFFIHTLQTMKNASIELDKCNN